VCRSHGLVGTFGPRSWRSARRTPPLYPDAVTLAPDASISDVLNAIDTSPGCSVKDSFGCLDLAQAGFTVLFEATWITRMAQVPLEPGWSRTDDPFGDPSVAVWSDGVSGVTANRDGDFAGLSNLYTHGDLDAALRNGYTALGPLRIWLK
jgi:hypothetical protein